MPLTGASPINQIAYVVKSLDEAIVWWNDVMHIGPFLTLRDLVFDESDYRGQAMPITYSAAISYSGDVIVELIEPKGPSIFEEYLAAGKNGVQHICVFTEDFRATAEAAEANGAKRLQGGRIGGGVLGYYAMGGDQSVVLEIAQLTPESLALFDSVRRAALVWDGTTRIFQP